LDQGKINALLYQHSRSHLFSSLGNSFGVRYGEAGFDVSLAMHQNLTQFAAYKSAWFVDLMKGKSKTEQDAIRAIYERQLVVEGEFTTRAGRSAKQWVGFEETKDRFPNLEYLPSRSVNRRVEHTKYYGMILPIDHPFWISGMVPNGYGCKCRVRPTDAQPTKALDPPKNPKGVPGNVALERKVFTDLHPFFANISKSGKGSINQEWRRLERQWLRNWGKKNLVGKTFPNDTFEGRIGINVKGLKSITNQPHDQFDLKNLLLMDLKNIIRKAEYLLTTDFQGEKGKGIFLKVHYFRIMLNETESYLNVRETINGEKWVYSITDKIKAES